MCFYILIWRAECNNVVRSTAACKGTVDVIVSVAISQRALVLEYLRVVCGRARRRLVILTSATVLRLVESCTRTLAGDNSAGPGHLQLSRAGGVDVGGAGRGLAVAGATLRRDGNGKVKAVDEAHVIEVLAPVGCNVDFN